MAYRIRPLGNYVVIKLHEEAEKTTAGGIVLPASTMQRPSLAEVMEVGPGLVNINGKTIPVCVSPGDSVLINRHAPVEWELPDGSKIHIIPEGDIIAIISE